MALWCLTTVAVAQVSRDDVMKIDVVALIDRAEEREGSADIALTHGRFTYWFANEGNKTSFSTSPDKYEIQLGGACARMGPLSGGGTPRLFAMHDDRVYIFASEQCRAAFVRAPAQFIDPGDPPLQATDESRAHGRALLGSAVDAIACLAFIDTITTYREVLAQDRESGGQTYKVTETVTLMCPSRIRSETCWNDSCWGFAADEHRGWSIDSEGVAPLHASQRQALMRDDGRHIISILQNRDADGVMVFGRGEKRIITVPGEGDFEVELVSVHRDGATTVLGLDNAGRARLMSYRGRGPNATMGTVEHIYSRFHDVGGLKLPQRVDVTFNGESVKEESGVYAEQVVNDPEDLEKFQLE